MKISLGKNQVVIIFTFLTLIINISQSLFLHAIWACVLLAVLLLNWNKKAGINWFSWFAIVMLFYLTLSYLWSVDTLLTIEGAKSIITEFATIVFLMVLISQRNFDDEFANKLVKTVTLTIFIFSIYVFTNTPISDWGRVYIGDTLGVGKNEVGMKCAWGIVFSFYLLKKEKNKPLYIMLIAVFAVFVLFAGSRKAILITVAGVTLLQLFSGGMKKNTVNILIGVLFVTISFYLIYENELFYSIIGVRMESTFDAVFHGGSGDGSMQERTFFKLHAMQLFANKPIIGYGINGFAVNLQRINFWHPVYSHCNYTELLANGGIIGFLLFYLPRFYLVIKTILKKMYKSDLLVSFLLICMIIELVMDYEMVSYYSITPQIIFCLSAPILMQKMKLAREHKRIYSEGKIYAFKKSNKA